MTVKFHILWFPCPREWRRTCAPALDVAATDVHVPRYLRDDGLVKPDPEPDDPVLPERSRDDSDIGWGEPPEPDDDERLRQDRPPHWDSP
jgi:hypothetical protein